MRKFITLILPLAMAATLTTGCSDKDADSAATDGTTDGADGTADGTDGGDDGDGGDDSDGGDGTGDGTDGGTPDDGIEFDDFCADLEGCDRGCCVLTTCAYLDTPLDYCPAYTNGDDTAPFFDACMATCSGQPALADIVNGLGDCSDVIDTVSGLSGDFAAGCAGE